MVGERPTPSGVPRLPSDRYCESKSVIFIITLHVHVVHLCSYITRLDRLERLISDGAAPFFLAITPYAPHVSGTDPPVPQTRYNTSFLDVPVPRFANWNPSDEIQKQKSVFIKDLLPLNSTQLEYCDFHHQRRLQALQGVDEIIEDVINLLEEKEQLENTYSKQFCESVMYYISD